jgi:hypothetical protein
MTWRVEGERDASACIRRHQAFALAPVDMAGNMWQALDGGGADGRSAVGDLRAHGRAVHIDSMNTRFESANGFSA